MLKFLSGHQICKLFIAAGHISVHPFGLVSKRVRLKLSFDMSERSGLLVTWHKSQQQSAAKVFR